MSSPGGVPFCTVDIRTHVRYPEPGRPRLPVGDGAFTGQVRPDFLLSGWLTRRGRERMSDEQDIGSSLCRAIFISATTTTKACERTGVFCFFCAFFVIELFIKFYVRCLLLALDGRASCAWGFRHGVGGRRYYSARVGIKRLRSSRPALSC